MREFWFGYLDFLSRWDRILCAIIICWTLVCTGCGKTSQPDVIQVKETQELAEARKLLNQSNEMLKGIWKDAQRPKLW